MPKGQGDELNTEAQEKEGFASKLSGRVETLLCGIGLFANGLTEEPCSREDAKIALPLLIMLIPLTIVLIGVLTIATGVEEIGNKIASGVEKMGNKKKPNLEPEKSLKPVLQDIYKEAEKNNEQQRVPDQHITDLRKVLDGGLKTGIHTPNPMSPNKTKGGQKSVPSR